MQRTFAMLKPDAVQRGLVGEIIARIERTGLRLVAMKMVRATQQQAEEQYGEEIARKHGEHVRQWLLEYIQEGPVVPMVWEGPNAISTVRAVAGDRPSPDQCTPGTIRRDLCTDSQELATADGRAIRNLIHTSDAPDSAEREMKIWFGPDELAEA